MQDPKTSQKRTSKPWYERAIGMATLWRSISKPSDVTKTASSSSSSSSSTNNRNNKNGNYLWKSISKLSTDQTVAKNNNYNRPYSERLRKCTSLKVATSFSRVCLCAPISSYNEVLRSGHNDQINNPPRRSYSYPRSKSNTNNNNVPINSLTCSPPQQLRAHSARHSIEVRRVFRGKSLTDDVLMRRFVVEEESMMQVKRRNQMEIIRKRNLMRRKKLGPSPLCRMVLAHHQYNLDDHHQHPFD